MAHAVDKNSLESFSEVANAFGYTTDNKISPQDDVPKYQNESYFECDGTEINDVTMDLNNADTIGEYEEFNHQNQLRSQLEFSGNCKKRKFSANNSTGSDPVVNDRKPFETVRCDAFLDEHDHFLQSLAPEIRKIDSKFNLHFRNEVHNLIIKYQSMSSNEE